MWLSQEGTKAQLEGTEYRLGSMAVTSSTKLAADGFSEEFRHVFTLILANYSGQ